MSFANFNFLNLTFLCLQKLSEKKKEKYKMRCDEMRRVYDQKLRDFYTANPGDNPLKKTSVGLWICPIQWGSEYWTSLVFEWSTVV